ncbi:nucleoside phosphorylase [Thermophagus xiamenensis]|uniref:Uridine phosphorylase n=1 Tax=Thermophagus xiamenensis TaxID=385682 RepID=A0A1I1VVY7_9BACT|nr:nucleoside phosphorylase [Thermophagus xiamenensis]SFD85183.1 uridine phosphorylase [Thermophagus xiamenensis]
MRRIEESELILNPDGSVFHLHIKPQEVADNIILVGDPGRVDTVAGFFDRIEAGAQNREFVFRTGNYKGTRFTVLSTGIGTDNIDIVLNELDALVNVDFESRRVKKEKKSLNIVRIGTSGSLQDYLPVDSWLLSDKAIGFDGLLNFYNGVEAITNHSFEEALLQFIGWSERLTRPYVVEANRELVNLLSGSNIHNGITISAPGFYGPQGRVIRLELDNAQINDKLSEFSFEGEKITNYEMECSAIYGLSQLLGHRAATVCAIIANRKAGTYSKNYKHGMKALIQYVLERLSR